MKAIVPPDGRTLTAPDKIAAVNSDQDVFTSATHPRRSSRIPYRGTLVSILLLMAFVLLRPCSAAGQTLTGRLVDNETGRGVINGTVALLDSMGLAVARVLSGSDGEFVIRAPRPGRYTVRSFGLGYRGGLLAQIELGAGETLHADIYLLPAPLALEPLEITSERIRTELERQGFWERLEKGHGFFLTPMQLKNRPPINEAEVLTRAPFVNLSREWTGTQITMRGTGGSCNPTILVDDFPTPKGGHIEDYVNFADIAAIEIYRGWAEIPPELALGLERCGAILIWTVWSERKSKKGSDGGVLLPRPAATTTLLPVLKCSNIDSEESSELRWG